MRQPSLTIGIEEEYQIIDPITRELRSSSRLLLDQGAREFADHVKPELHQSIVEASTDVCKSPAAARAEIISLRRSVIELAEKNGLAIAAAGTHPFSSWTNQPITDAERYADTRQEMQDLAQQLLIFGTHVHIGIEDRDFLVDAMNVARYFIPHLLALSASSPFWLGRLTGLHSYRSIVFRNFPRTGIPPIFTANADLNYYVETLVKTHSIANVTKIWWDVRPNGKYPTLEFRVCDACTTVDEAVCIAALVQALIFKLYKLRRDNLTFRIYPTVLIEENKWRAVRYGLDGNLLDLGKQEEVPARNILHEFVDWFLADAINELGSENEVKPIYQILERGSSAQRQMEVYRNTGSLSKVVDHLIRETRQGVC